MASLAERQEALRVEFEALLNVLMARQSCAKDYDDWTIIATQARDLAKLAQRLRNYAGL